MSVSLAAQCYQLDANGVFLRFAAGACLRVELTATVTLTLTVSADIFSRYCNPMGLHDGAAHDRLEICDAAAETV